MRKLVLTVLAACAVSASAAEDPNWGLVATLDNGTKIHGKYGSFERYDGAGSMVVRFTGKNTISFYVIGISDKTCDQGYGDLTFFDTGFRLLRKENYVAKGGNGIAMMGDLLCVVISKSKLGGNI